MRETCSESLIVSSRYSSRKAVDTPSANILLGFSFAFLPALAPEPGLLLVHQLFHSQHNLTVMHPDIQEVALLYVQRPPNGLGQGNLRLLAHLD